MRLGVMDFIEKPTDLEVLTEKIKKAQAILVREFSRRILVQRVIFSAALASVPLLHCFGFPGR